MLACVRNRSLRIACGLVLRARGCDLLKGLRPATQFGMALFLVGPPLFEILGQSLDKMPKNKNRGYDQRRNPLFFLVPRDRIELPTRGFSGTTFEFSNILNSLKVFVITYNPFFNFYLILVGFY